jgi:hypothetical protein
MSFPLDDRYRALVRDHIAPALKQEGYDKWWRLAPTTRPALVDGRIGAEVRRGLVGHVFPYLHQYRSLEEVGAALRNGSDRVINRHLPVGYDGIVQRGLVLWLTGDRRGGLAPIRALTAQHRPDSPAMDPRRAGAHHGTAVKRPACLLHLGRNERMIGA